MEHEQPDLVEQLLEFIYQLISPEWPDLIALMPVVFLVILGLFLAGIAYVWFRAGSRNRPRVPRPLAAGAPPPGIHMPGPSKWPFVLPIGGTLILFAFVLPPRDEAGQITFPLNLPLFGLGMLITLVGMAGWLLDAMREWRAEARTSEAVAGTLAPGTQPVGALPARAGEARREAPAEPPPGVHMPGPSPWPFFAPIGITMIFFGLILSWWLVLGGLALAIIAAAGWYLESSHEYRTTEALGHPVPKTRDPRVAWPARLIPVYVLVGALSVGLWLGPPFLGQLLAGLTPPPPGEETPPPVPAVPEITARTAVSFETNLLLVPSDRDFELIFHNEHAGVPHDVAITDGPGLDIVYFDGELVTGPETITYQVPELPEGDYYFLCTVHPNMNGTVQARPEEPGEAPQEPGEVPQD
jgi:hypothetical protein